mmetsp:Transcript_20540/g.58679  ORF Transcript_20540/g.58679 Transcript_20540/m.58679 type:complete len:223 (+) Transcript_20540:457-1125(+)
MDCSSPRSTCRPLGVHRSDNGGGAGSQSNKRPGEDGAAPGSYAGSYGVCAIPGGSMASDARLSGCLWRHATAPRLLRRPRPCCEAAAQPWQRLQNQEQQWPDGTAGGAQHQHQGVLQRRHQPRFVCSVGPRHVVWKDTISAVCAAAQCAVRRGAEASVVCPTEFPFPAACVQGRYSRWAPAATQPRQPQTRHCWRQDVPLPGSSRFRHESHRLRAIRAREWH